MESSKSMNISLSNGTRLIKTTVIEVLIDPKEYQSMIGSLMYIILTIRSDLT
jgi:hypothetical protein